MRMFARTAFVAMALAASAAHAAVSVSPTESGFAINAGEGGSFSLSLPLIGAGEKYEKPTEVTVKGTKLNARYANGAAVQGDLQANGSCTLHFTALPDQVKNLRFTMNLPLTLQGGSFAIDGGNPIAFPAEAVPDAFLFKGNAKKFALTPPKGDAFAITLEHGYQQVQDNRVWKMQTYQWIASTQMPRSNGNEGYFTLRIADPKAEAVAVSTPKPAAAAPVPAASLSLKFTEKHIAISAGTAGTLSLEYPKIAGKKPLSVATDATSATVQYPDDLSARLSIEKTNLKIAVTHAPAKAKLRMDGFIPINFGGGGTFSVGGAAAKPFPSEKPANAYLFQGNAELLEVMHPTGAGVSITVPKYSFLQLQDNREWNWPIYCWWFETPLPEGNANPEITLKFAQPGGQAVTKPVVDRYGQWAKADFPTKVKSDDDLRADVASEKQWIASLQPPATDPWGGLPDSGSKLGLKKTGFFHLEKINRGNTTADVLVTPEGNAFFQLGLCGALGQPMDDYTTVRGRESIYEWLPSQQDPLFRSAWRPNDPGVFSFRVANVIRKYGEPFDPSATARRWVERLRAWGYNSAGAWSVPAPVEGTARELKFAYTPFVPIPTLPQVSKGIWDPFTPGAAEKFDQAMAKIDERAGDPPILGYFISNEPILEDVAKTIPTLKASKSPAKAKLIAMLKEKYGTVEQFNAAWDAKAASFDEAAEQPLPVATRASAEDASKLYKEFLEARYSLVNTAFRKHDPNHLLIGDRWQPGTANSEVLVTTAGKYLDIVSVNYYAYGIDKNFLDRLHAWGGKPMLLSEYFFSANDQGLHGGLAVVNQTQRGLAYRNYVEQAANTGYVVGMQWFQAIDQATTGRFFEGFNGEATNAGIVNVADRPYREFLVEAMKTNYGIYDVLLGKRPAFIYDDPRFTFKRGESQKTVSIPRMTSTFTLDGSQAKWPTVPPNRIGTDRLVQGATADGFEASFRVAWDDENLYLLVQVSDSTPMHNANTPVNLWRGDAVELFVGSEDLKSGGGLKFSDRQVLIRGAVGRSAEETNVFIGNAAKQIPARSVVVPSLDGKGYTLEAAIPFAALGITPKSGQELLFDLAVDDSEDGHERKRQIVFNGNERNSKDRGVWGRAVLVNK